MVTRVTVPRVDCTNSDQPGRAWHYETQYLTDVRGEAARLIGGQAHSGNACVGVTIHWDNNTTTKITPSGE